MVTQITALPAGPAETQSSTDFRASANALFSGGIQTFVTEANTQASEVNALALNAESAAGELANAVWVSGTTYTAGQVRYSPIDYLNYRRKTNGAGTTDPSADTTNWALLTKTSNGGAEEQSSAVDITLTSSNQRVQSIAMTAPLKSVKLPAPGTLGKGLAFIIKNVGSYRFAMRNNAGKIVALLDVGVTVALNLVDVATDKWTALGSHDSTGAGMAGLMEVINAVASSIYRITRLSDTKALGAYWDGTNAKVVVITDDLDGTVSVGTPVTVTGTSTQIFDVCAVSSTAAVFVHRVGTATQSIVITVSGTVPSIGGSPGTIDASSSATDISLVQVSSTRAHVVYIVSTSVYARVIDVSGSVTTPGAQSTSNSAVAGVTSQALISSTQVLVSFKTSGGLVSSCVYNISGTTTTPATPVNTASTTAINYHATLYISAGVGVVLHTANANSTPYNDIVQSVFTISGSVISNVARRGLNLQNSTTHLTVSKLTDGRIVLICGDSPWSQTNNIHVLRWDGQQLVVDASAQLSDVYAQSSESAQVALAGNRIMCMRKSSSGYAGAFLTEVVEA